MRKDLLPKLVDFDLMTEQMIGELEAIVKIIDFEI